MLAGWNRSDAKSGSSSHNQKTQHIPAGPASHSARTMSNSKYIPTDHSEGRASLIDLFHRKLPTELKDEVYSYLWADTISTIDYSFLVEQTRPRFLTSNTLHIFFDESFPTHNIHFGESFDTHHKSRHTILLSDFTQVSIVGRDFAQGAVAWYYNNHPGFNITFDDLWQLHDKASNFLLTDTFDVGITPSSFKLRKVTFEYTGVAELDRMCSGLPDPNPTGLSLLRKAEKLLGTRLWNHTKLEFVFSAHKPRWLSSKFYFGSHCRLALELWPMIHGIQETKDLPIDIIYKHERIDEFDLVPLLRLDSTRRLEAFTAHCINIARTEKPCSLWIGRRVLWELLEAIGDQSSRFTIDEIRPYVRGLDHLFLGSFRGSLDWRTFINKLDVELIWAALDLVRNPSASFERWSTVEDVVRIMSDEMINTV